MKNIAVIVNEKKDTGYVLTKEVLSFLSQNGCIIYLENDIGNLGIDSLRKLSSSNISECNMILVIGGDGTMLHAIYQYAVYNIPFIGINIGQIGFLADLSPNGYQECLRNIFSEHYVIEERTTVCLKNGDEILGYALNEIMFRHRQGSGVGTFGLKVDEVFLTTYIGDGVLVSAPTGSTAYSFSAGGPIVNPNCDVMIIQPLSPHSLNNRSIVVDGSESILVEYNPKESVVYIDGMQVESTKERLTVQKSNLHIKFIRTMQYNFYSLLFDKLIQDNQIRGEKQ